MKKIIGMVLFLTGTIFSSFAGDAAVFVDGGFSKDGKVYVFGQYGKTDKTFEGWADIYAVDVKSNDYIDGEVFKIKPSAVTNNKTGKEVYDSLVAQSYYKLKKYNFDIVLDITSYNKNDVQGIYESVGDVPDYIFLSSSAVYPETEEQPFMENAKVGFNKFWKDYGMNKIEAEEYWCAYN